MSDIDRYLNLIGEEIQLPRNKFEEINKNYKALAEYIGNQHELADNVECSIYYHGSFSLDTVIKPLKGDDFDIDMVVEFDISKRSLTASEFYQYLVDTFADGRYKANAHEHRNCVTIDYKNNYHVDIMPAVPLYKGSKTLEVPDADKEIWVKRYTKAYREWFLAQSQQVKFYKKKVTIRENIFYMEDEVKPLTPPQPYELKPTLNRIVQLLKRARDEYFYNTDDFIPQSIVLTTIAAKNYKGEFSIFEGLKSLAKRMVGMIGTYFDVYNPVSSNNSEDFTEKWKKDTRYYKNFNNFANFFYEEVNKLNNPETSISALKALFGVGTYEKIRNDTAYDFYWTKTKTNIENKKVFPNEEVKIKKKERGNA